MTFQNLENMVFRAVYVGDIARILSTSVPYKIEATILKVIIVILETELKNEKKVKQYMNYKKCAK